MGHNKNATQIVLNLPSSFFTKVPTKMVAVLTVFHQAAFGKDVKMERVDIESQCFVIEEQLANQT